MAVQGEVVGAAWMPLGSEVTEAAPDGALAVTVANPVDFDDDGGIIDIDGTPLEFDTIDEDTGMLTLDEPLPAAIDEGHWVGLRVGGAVASDLILYVSLGDGDEIEIPAPYAERDKWPEGEYEQPVPVIVSDDLEAVLDVPGRIPIIDGSFIDPGTLPEPGGPSEPPESSPALTITGTANGLVVRAEEVAPSTRIAYHLTATPPIDENGEPAPFPPTAETLIGEPTRSTVLVVTELPDGAPLALDATYYLRAVASNDLGEAPPGPMATGRLDASVIADVVAESLTAGFVLAGSIQVGQITIDPDSGITIPTADGGLTHFPADGSEASITGALRTNDLVVQNNLVVNGESNAIAGTLGLASVVSAPKGAPVVTQTWDYMSAIGAGSWSLTESPDGLSWVTVNGPSNSIRKYSKATGAQEADFGSYAGWQLRSVARLGNEFFASAYVFGAPSNQHVLRLSATGALLDSWQVTANWSTGMTIGTDGTNVMVAWTRGDGASIGVRTFTTSGTLVDGLVYDTSASMGNPNLRLSTIGRAPIGPGGEVWTFFGPGAGLAVLDDVNLNVKFEPVTPEPSKGAVFTADGRLVWLSYDSHRPVEFSLQEWPAVEVGFTWYDNDPAGDGTHETTLSPTVFIQPDLWSALRVTTPPPPDKGQPDDPNAVRIYLNGARQADLDPGATTARYSELDTTGPPPPAANEFAGAVANPGVIRSDSVDADGPIIELRGNGAGRVGPLEWDALGRQADAPASGSAVISLVNQDRNTVDITFDHPFSTTPVINVNPSLGSYIAAVQSKSPTGCTLLVRYWVSAGASRTEDVTVDWTAGVPTQ